jgi:trk system potassium uptake protein TrkH
VVLRRRSLQPIVDDREIRTYVAVLALSTVLVAILLLQGEHRDPLEALRTSAFHVVSMATTTGFFSDDYAKWPVFAPVFLLFLGCWVSCAGSTGGGIKMVRMVLLVKQARREMVRIIHTRVVNPVTLSGQVVPPTVMAAVLGFMLIYGATIVGLTMVLLLTGMDVVTAFTSVIATLNTIGLGLGEVGPTGHFGGLNAVQLWVLSASMLLGRLELLTVLVLFTGHFWRK